MCIGRSIPLSSLLDRTKYASWLDLPTHIVPPTYHTALVVIRTFILRTFRVYEYSMDYILVTKVEIDNRLEVMLLSKQLIFDHELNLFCGDSLVVANHGLDSLYVCPWCHEEGNTGSVQQLYHNVQRLHGT